MELNVLSCFVLSYSLFYLSDGARTNDKIYVDIDSHSVCFRRLNATHQVGCSTGRNGNVGVVHYIENSTDIDWLLTVGPHDPYIALLTPAMFTRDVVIRLENSGKVNGIMVIHTNDSESPLEFSSSTTCPNENLDMYVNDPDYAHCKNVTWNAPGNNLFYEDHNIPIFAVTNYTEVQGLINDCYKFYNEPTSGGLAREYPLCAAELKDAMDAAVDTPTCIRRSNTITNLNPQTYCDPLGDFNVYGFVQPINGSDSELRDSSIVVAATTLDGVGMFDKLHPSADSAMTGIVTMLAAAEALGKVKADLVNALNPLMMIFFHGESFDYIGSGRVVRDMMQGDFPYKLNDGQVGVHPINLNHINSVVEISQVGLTDEGKVWMHTDPISRRDASVDALVTNLLSKISTVAGGVSLDIDSSPSVQPLPPASLQSFLKEASSTPGVVIADHKAAYTNKYYHSLYDKPLAINMSYPDGLTEEEKYNYITAIAEQLTKVATVTARSLYELSTGNPAPAGLVANSTVMANLLYCFGENNICELFNYTLESINSQRLSNRSISYYVGTSTSSTVSWVSKLAYNLLHYFLGDEVQLTSDQCQDYKDGDEVSYEDCCKKLPAHQNDMFYSFLYINGPIDTSASEYKRQGLCYKSTVNMSRATSPAFEDGYDWSSNKYSAWTESRWANDAIFVRYFLVPPLDMEVTTLSVGAIVLWCSLPIVYMIRQRSHLLFTDPGIL